LGQQRALVQLGGSARLPHQRELCLEGGLRLETFRPEPVLGLAAHGASLGDLGLEPRLAPDRQIDRHGQADHVVARHAIRRRLTLPVLQLQVEIRVVLALSQIDRIAAALHQ
jgi:hypothetical protein